LKEERVSDLTKTLTAAEMRADLVDYFGGIDSVTGRPWGGNCYVRSIDAWYDLCRDCLKLTRQENPLAGDVGKWFERLAAREGAGDDAARERLHARVLPVLRDVFGVADLAALDAEGRRRHRDDNPGDHSSRCPMPGRYRELEEFPVRHAALVAACPLSAGFKALLGRSLRYKICIVGPDLLEVSDQRYALDNFLKWPPLWPDEGLLSEIGDDAYALLLNMFADRTAGPDITGADDDLLTYLDQSAGAWSDAGLVAEPPDPTVNNWHGLVWER
jgi:hypothetical protein